MSRTRRALLAGTAALSLPAALPGCASPTGNASLLRAPPATLPGSRQQDLRDAVSGRVWRIWLQLPEGPPPPGGYPVLYTLDGNACFALAAQLARNSAVRPAPLRPDPVLVVGIGHPVDAVIDQPLRNRDYTPPAPGAALDAPSEAPYGGGDLLLDFITRQLRPQLQQGWALDPLRQTLFGHSFGGLLTLHSLFTHPAAFTRYAAASPSIWWHDAQLLVRCAAFEARYAQTPRPWALQLALYAGSLETVPGAANAARARVQERRRTLEQAGALARRLQALAWPELSVRFTALAGMDHGTAMAPALIDALALAQRPA